MPFFRDIYSLSIIDILYTVNDTYKTIEHVLHCENIIHIPTLFHYYREPHSYTPFFYLQCFFYLLMTFLFEHNRYSISTVNDFKHDA